MNRRGAKPQGKVSIKWSPKFAYAIGLLVTDGCLYNNGRHIAFVSKEIQQIKNFTESLNLSVKIGKTISGHNQNHTHRIQFGDVQFHNFLVSLGLMPAKSKTIGKIAIPDRYFFDYLRGCFDGDGTFYSYWDPRWRSSFMFYICFVSASKKNIEWLQDEIFRFLGIKGHITNAQRRSWYQLKYAKKEALEIIKRMYYSQDVVCLSRKRLKIEKALVLEKKQQTTYKK